MAAIDDAINSLSEDELDLLNSDPEMLAAFKAKYSGAAPAKPPSVLDKAAGGVARLIMRGGPGGVLGDETKAGMSGIVAGLNDLTAGPTGPDNTIGRAANVASDEISRVEDGLHAATPAGKLGEAIGDQATPIQIALQAGGAKIAEAIGPATAALLKGWAGDMAANAVGKIKSLASNLGITNLDGLGQLLLRPLSIGGREFEPIVTAGSSPQAMLDKTKAILLVAGKQLGVASDAVDAAAKSASDELVSSAPGTVAPVLDTGALLKSVQELKEEAVGDLPNLGKPVAKQFNDALADLEEYIRTQATSANENSFSKLSAIKTKIGNLVYKHGSPLESKAALLDVYHAVSDALENAANKVGGQTADQYAQANSVYHQLLAVREGLEGKVIDAKKLFDGPAFLAALSAGLSTIGAGHGILAGVTAPLAYGGAKLGEMFGPQLIAQGLDKGAPLVAKGLELSVRGIPILARGAIDGYQAISDGLSRGGQ